MKRTDKKSIEQANYFLHNGTYLIKHLNRIFSYKHQIELALRDNPRKALIVGMGDGIVGNIISSSGIEVFNLDCDYFLNPDIAGSVEELPIRDQCVDITLCCQVLEHLKFESFEKSLKEIARITKRKMILSLPDIRNHVSFRIKIPFFSWNYQISIPKIRKRKVERISQNTGHFWEIGLRGYNLDKVIQAIRSANWVIKESFRVYDFPWHHFFYCKKIAK